VCSVYRWKGEIAREEESILLIKSEAALFESVRAAIRELHSYELPEVVAVPLEHGDADYLAWLSASVGAP
jgi:periplasmic divalent cation tolerance protein